MSPVHRFSHEAMNTVFEVRACHEDAGYAGQAAHAAFLEVDRLEQELSRFVANSDVARVNALAAGGVARVSPSTLECLVVARHVYDLTGGAFDVSIGTGLAGLELDGDAFSVRAHKDGIRLDLGGIGKGYAVDRMAEVLEEWGVGRALVHGGASSVLALEPPEGAAFWSLTLSAPLPGLATVLERLEGRQRALSASGTRKRDHIVDPHSGRPAASGAVWVSIPRSREAEHLSATVAEGLSTGFMILPVERIEAICRNNPGLEVFRFEPGGAEPAVIRLGGPEPSAG